MKTILITGSTDGIGFESAKMFAKAGHNLLLHGRSLSKLENTKKQLLQINSNLKVNLYVADFANLQDVYVMADNILQEHKSIDILINNAGVFVVDDEHAITKDNLDVRFQVNTIAPYILTNKLLPLFNDTSRVINLGSAAQMPLDLNALVNQRRLSPSEAYAQSKLALMMWSMEMAEDRKTGAIFISINPKSFLGSKMVKEAYGQKGHDLKIGADILYKAALSDEFSDANGKYFDNDYGMFASPHPFALAKKNRLDLLDSLKSIIK